MLEPIYDEAQVYNFLDLEDYEYIKPDLIIISGWFLAEECTWETVKWLHKKFSDYPIICESSNLTYLKKAEATGFFTERYPFLKTTILN